MSDAWLNLPLPLDWAPAVRRAFITYAIRLIQAPPLADNNGTRMMRSTDRIGNWWFDRWLSWRIGSPEVLAVVGQHTVDQLMKHGARVVLPE